MRTLSPRPPRTSVPSALERKAPELRENRSTSRQQVLDAQNLFCHTPTFFTLYSHLTSSRLHTPYTFICHTPYTFHLSHPKHFPFVAAQLWHHFTPQPCWLSYPPLLSPLGSSHRTPSLLFYVYRHCTRSSLSNSVSNLICLHFLCRARPSTVSSASSCARAATSPAATAPVVSPSTE